MLLTALGGKILQMSKKIVKKGGSYPRVPVITANNTAKPQPHSMVDNVLEERVSDCCLTPNSAICQLYHGENKLIFNEMVMRPAFF